MPADWWLSLWEDPQMYSVYCTLLATQGRLSPLRLSVCTPRLTYTSLAKVTASQSVMPSVPGELYFTMDPCLASGHLRLA
jgi:hypothetical protein